MRKARKTIKDITQVSMLGAAGSTAVTVLGGSAAGIANATRYLGTTGRMAGIGMMMDSMKGLEPKKRKRRKRK